MGIWCIETDRVPVISGRDYRSYTLYTIQCTLYTVVQYSSTQYTSTQYTSTQYSILSDTHVYVCCTSMHLMIREQVNELTMKDGQRVH